MLFMFKLCLLRTIKTSTHEIGHTLSMTSLAVDILDIVKEDYFRTDSSTLPRELGCGAPHL